MSFYKPSDVASGEAHSVFEKARIYMADKIEKGYWDQRSVGWFQINLDENPEMAFDPNAPNAE